MIWKCTKNAPITTEDHFFPNPCCTPTWLQTGLEVPPFCLMPPTIAQRWSSGPKTSRDGFKLCLLINKHSPKRSTIEWDSVLIGMLTHPDAPRWPESSQEPISTEINSFVNCTSIAHLDGRISWKVRLNYPHNADDVPQTAGVQPGVGGIRRRRPQ